MTREKHTDFTPAMAVALSHYIEDPQRNRMAAYRAAYDTRGMTVWAIHARSKRLFNNPIMVEAVKHIALETLQKVQVDAQYVADRLHLLSEFNIGKFIVVDEEGHASYDFTDATADDWYCIDEYSVDTSMQGSKVSERVRIKATPRLAALKTLGELASVAAFRENIKVEGEFTVRNFNDFYNEEEADDGGEA